MGARRADVAVILKAADGAWTSLGKDIAPGIVPENVTVSANEHGPDTCSFLLRRDATVPWPDLLAFNQAEVWVGGVPVWGGRVWEAPISDTDQDQIAVMGRGWQYHLDDDMLRRFWVHTTMGDWRDQRSFASATLAAYTAIGEVTQTNGALTLLWRSGSTTAGFDHVGVTMDFGENANGAKHIVVEYESSNNGSPLVKFYARNHTLESEDESVVSGSVTDAISGTLLTTLGASGTVEGTFSSRYRYCTLFLYLDTGTPGSFGADHWIRLKSVKVFAETGFESSNASILKASDVVEDVLGSGTLPLLSSSTSEIDASSFSIPDFSPDGYQTPRQLIAAANAYEANLYGVTVDRKLFYRERPTTALIECGAWSGADFQDASTNSAEGLYNKVIVQGTGPDGAAIQVERTATSGLLTRQGFTRTATLGVNSAITTTAAQQIGDLWLAEKSSPQLKGTLVVKRHGAVRSIGGAALHPSELLLMCGQRIRLAMIDPADGSWGRDGTIKSVSYAQDSETATVEIDNERGRFSALLERLAVVTDAALR